MLSLALLCSVLLVEQQSKVKRPSVAMPPRRSKIKCLRDSVAWLVLFHTLSAPPLSLSLSSLPLLSLTICRAPFLLAPRGPKPGSFTSCLCHPLQLVSRCASARNANARTKSNLVALACGYEKVEIVLGPRNCLAGNLELIWDGCCCTVINQSINQRAGELGLVGGGTGKCWSSA